MKNRVIGYDLARALAIFGMVVVNYKVVMGAGQNGPAWLVSWAGLFDGRAAATFVVLAGVGLSLLSRKGRAEGDHNRVARDRALLLKRALFLFVVGLLYTPIWPADILHFYGVYLAVGAFLLVVPARRLWALALALILGFAVMLFTLDYNQGWHWKTLSYDGFWTPGGMIRHIFFNGFHPVLPWLAYLLVGMVLGRMEMGAAVTRRKVFFWGAGAAIAAEITSRFFVRAFSGGVLLGDQETLLAIFGTTPMPPNPLYMIAGAGTACAVIALSISFGERFRNSAWLRPFVSTGQLALTLYVGHVVVGMGILEMIGRLEDQSLIFSLLASVLFCTIGIIFAHFWRKRFQRGPLEMVMRAITESKKGTA